jgi:hypothetical protein
MIAVSLAAIDDAEIIAHLTPNVQRLPDELFGPGDRETYGRTARILPGCGMNQGLCTFQHYRAQIVK